MLPCLVLNNVPTIIQHIVHFQGCDEYCYSSWEDFNLGIPIGSYSPGDVLLKALLRRSIEMENIWFGFRQSSVVKSAASGIKLSGPSVASFGENLGMIIIPTLGVL